MSEYTVTYPIHLGQEIYVQDTMVLSDYSEECEYLTGTIMGLSIWKHGENSKKMMHILLADDRVPKRKKMLKIPVSAMGNTVFGEKPEG